MAIVADSVVEDVCKKFGITLVQLKPKQIEAIQSFVNGNDVFCCLPTGYGKSSRAAETGLSGASDGIGRAPALVCPSLAMPLD